MLNYSLYCDGCAILYWLILYDSYASRFDQYEFWETIKPIGMKLQIEKFEYFTVLILLLIGDTFIFTLALIYQINDSNNTSKQLMHLVFMNIVGYRTFFYLLHLKIISHQLCKITFELKKLNVQKCDVEHRLKSIRNNFLVIHKLTDCVNMTAADRC